MHHHHCLLCESELTGAGAKEGNVPITWLLEHLWLVRIALADTNAVLSFVEQ